MDDLISRQAAIDAIKDLESSDDFGFNNGLICTMNLIAELPSAQPDQSIEIQDILEYLDTVLHPIISPDHWSVYAELHDMVSMLSSAQPEITFDDVMRYCRPRCLYVIPSETFRGLLGGKQMNDIKALIEELEIQHEAWGKKYSFEMILRDIEKYAEEHKHETSESV